VNAAHSQGSQTPPFFCSFPFFTSPTASFSRLQSQCPFTCDQINATRSFWTRASPLFLRVHISFCVQAPLFFHTPLSHTSRPLLFPTAFTKTLVILFLPRTPPFSHPVPLIVRPKSSVSLFFPKILGLTPTLNVNCAFGPAGAPLPSYPFLQNLYFIATSHFNQTLAFFSYRASLFLKGPSLFIISVVFFLFRIVNQNPAFFVTLLLPLMPPEWLFDLLQFSNRCFLAFFSFFSPPR